MPKMAEKEFPETLAQSGAIEEVLPEEIPFNLTAVKTKPKRKYRKGSKYDPLIDAFLSGKANMVECTVEGKDANYLRTQINKRIEAQKLESKMSVSVVNNILFLQKK